VELPAVGDRVRWEFMQLPGETEQELKNDRRIMALITDNTRYREVQIERKAVYTFHARVADRWRNGRGFLAGDAAHLMPPFAGQGMNGGMKDAVNLAWKLSSVLKGLAAETILDSYEQERAPVVRKINPRQLRAGTRASGAQDGRGVATTWRRDHADQPTRRRVARRDLRLPKHVTCVSRFHRPWRGGAAAGDRPQRANRGRERCLDRPDAAAAKRQDDGRLVPARCVSGVAAVDGARNRH
jgi:flavin-dependent dehydrogenase